MNLQRFAATLTAVWAGIMIGVGYVFAPVLFKMMATDKQFAGEIAGEAFTVIAYISLVFGVILMAIIRRENTRAALTTPSAALHLILVAVSLAIINHFIITPELVLAKTGVNTQLSFATLHAMSNIVYAAQIIVLLVLNWFLNKPLGKASQTTQLESESKNQQEQDS